MANRIWIVARKEALEDSDFVAAKANNCSQIANGIPPALAGTILELMLPCAYKEPTPLPDPAVIKRQEALARAITAIKANATQAPWGKVLYDLAISQGWVEE